MTTLRLHAIINSTIPAPAMMVGEGAGTLNLKVRFLVIRHPQEGIILVDAGYGPEILSLGGIKGTLYRSAVNPPALYCTPAEALHQIGSSIEDVRHVILTHLHADHICNLGLVPPDASLHLSGRDAVILSRYARTGRAPRSVQALFPELIHGHLFDRVQSIDTKPLIEIEDAVRIKGFDILGDSSIYAIRLPGHTASHFGLFMPCVDGCSQGVLYAVDTAWTLRGLAQDKEPILGRISGHDPKSSSWSRKLVRSFQEAGHLVVLCHDPDETRFDLNPKDL